MAYISSSELQLLKDLRSEAERVGALAQIAQLQYQKEYLQVLLKYQTTEELTINSDTGEILPISTQTSINSTETKQQ